MQGTGEGGIPLEDLLHKDVGDVSSDILLGPIVRRVTNHTAAVFVATKSPAAVTLVVYDYVFKASAEIARSEPADTVALGANLHVAVVQVGELPPPFAPDDPGSSDATPRLFESDHVYGYDLLIRPDGGTERGLQDQGLLQGPEALGYIDFRYPGFVVPGARHDLKLVQASCRKPHGCHHGTLTDPDALPIVDRLIQDSLDLSAEEEAKQRPKLLLLTGDQIYSDDVPAAMLAALTSLGRHLLSWARPERFPDRFSTDYFTTEPVVEHAANDRIRPGERSHFLDDQAVKDRPPSAEPYNWSDYAANHLLFFSEWCAMYCMAWSPVLWKERDDVDPDHRIAHPNDSRFYLPATKDVWDPEEPDTEPGAKPPPFPDTTTPALIYAEGLPLVRRALANVSTLMGIDDHDVTDDWFLNLKVHDQLRNGRPDDPSAGGRRLMRNALAAVAIFQHWGNQPEAFAPGTPGGDLLAMLDTPPGGTPLIGLDGQDAAADTILDVGREPVGPDRRHERIRWDFDVVYDDFRVLFLDTRTWRSFPHEADPPPETSLLRAAQATLDPPQPWSSERIGAAGAALRSADAELRAADGDLADFVAALAGLLEAAGPVAALGLAGAGSWEPAGASLLGAASELLTRLEAAPDVAAMPWAKDALGDGGAVLDGGFTESLPDAREGVQATSVLLEKVALLLEWACPRYDATFAPHLARAGAAGAGERAAGAVWTIRAVVQHAADVTAAAGISHADAATAEVALLDAARNAAILAPDWFGVPAPPALYGAAGGVDGQQRLAAVVADEHVGYVDPVWDLLVGRGNARLNPALISEEAVGFQVTERAAQADRLRPVTFVVSPAPVFGHWLVEFVQKLGVVGLEVTEGNGGEAGENEPWNGHLGAWYGFIEALAELGPAVILSGDVHYGFSTTNDYLGSNGTRARFVQLTSSAAKNADSVTRALATWDEVEDDFIRATSWQADWAEFLPLLSDPALSYLPSWDGFLGLVNTVAMAPIRGIEWHIDKQMHWMRATATILTPNPIEIARSLQSAVEVQLDRAQARYQKLCAWWHSDLQFDFLVGLPLVRHQLHLLAHQLGLDPAQVNRVTTEVLHDPRESFEDRATPDLVGRVGLGQSLHARVDRRTVGHANIGVVSIDTLDGRDTVVHELHWFLHDRPPALLGVGPPPPPSSFRGDWMVTRHVAGLDPSLPMNAATLPPP